METHLHAIYTGIYMPQTGAAIRESGVSVDSVDDPPVRRACARVRACACVGVRSIYTIYTRGKKPCGFNALASVDGQKPSTLIYTIYTGLPSIWAKRPKGGAILAKSGEKYPTEAEEQIELARRLDSAGLVWFAIPNGGSRHVLEARNLVRQGVKSGVPDLVILSPTPAAPRGVALELKRARPVGRLEDVRPDQWVWLARFESAGFRALVGLGWRDSVRQLQQLGYEVQG